MLNITSQRILHGANYFSAGPVVLLRLDLEEYDEVYTSEIAGFLEKLQAAMPSLQQHHCSIGKPGGFFQRVKDGTLLGHVLEHVAIELQTLAGMDVAYGKTRSTLTQGVYHVIYRFFDEEAGLYAGKAAYELICALLEDKIFDVNAAVSALIDIREQRLLGPGTQAIVAEAEKRGIPWLRLDSYNLIQLGTGCFQKRLRATISSDTSQIAVETADKQYLTLQLLRESGLPVPACIRSKDPSEVLQFFKEHQHGIVIKPVDGRLGDDITLGITRADRILPAFNRAAARHEEVLAQQHIHGDSYRLLVINYRFAAATRLSPPKICGDGKSSIRQLVDALNADPMRQKGDKGKLSLVMLDAHSLELLADQGYTADSILPAGTGIALKISGNPGIGGFTEDVTEKVHPQNIFFAERAARVLGLNIAGIDMISNDITKPLSENGGVILELNASPGLRMHLMPAMGKAVNVAAPLVDMLFPGDSKKRVPVIAITGTSGSDFACKLLDFCMKRESYKTGTAHREGLYINGHLLKPGDMSGPGAAALVLKDPVIDCAILEVSLGGILQDGLGYPLADIGIVLNVATAEPEHDDLECVEDVAYAMSVVAEEVYEEGYTVLNADDPMVYEMRKRLYSKLILLGSQWESEAMLSQVAKGGRAVGIKAGELVMASGGVVTSIITVDELKGNNSLYSDENLTAIMAVAAALMVRAVVPQKIREHLLAYRQ
jgi:cyanophycin synthetase